MHRQLFRATSTTRANHTLLPAPTPKAPPKGLRENLRAYVKTAEGPPPGQKQTHRHLLIGQHHQGKPQSSADSLALANTLTPSAEHFPLSQNQAPMYTYACGNIRDYKDRLSLGGRRTHSYRQIMSYTGANEYRTELAEKIDTNPQTASIRQTTFVCRSFILVKWYCDSRRHKKQRKGGAFCCHRLLQNCSKLTKTLESVNGKATHPD